MPARVVLSKSHEVEAWFSECCFCLRIPVHSATSAVRQVETGKLRWSHTPEWDRRWPPGSTAMGVRRGKDKTSLLLKIEAIPAKTQLFLIFLLNSFYSSPDSVSGSPFSRFHSSVSAPIPWDLPIRRCATDPPRRRETVLRGCDSSWSSWHGPLEPYHEVTSVRNVECWMNEEVLQSNW